MIIAKIHPKGKRLNALPLGNLGTLLPGFGIAITPLFFPTLIAY
jgi:hypothetical protein